MGGTVENKKVVIPEVAWNKFTDVVDEIAEALYMRKLSGDAHALKEALRKVEGLSARED